MDEKQLAEIEAREKAATKGPWEANTTSAGRSILYVDAQNGTGRRGIATITPTFEDDFRAQNANGAFIAHARSDVPALISEVRRLGRQIQEIREQVAAIRPTLGDQASPVDTLRELRRLVEQLLK